MTPEQIIEMAKQANIEWDDAGVCTEYRVGLSQLQAFAKLIRNVALEESALLCDARSERGSPAAAADEAGLIGEQIRSLKS